MKKKLGLLFGIMVAALMVVASSGDGETKSYEIDTKESKVLWKGKKVTGEHVGYLQFGDGTVSVKDNNVISANVNMDLNTIECTDLTGEWKDKLVGHLKSEDFFSVEKHPKANFKITSINKKGSEQTVVGDLTLKGMTHEISFPAKVSIEGETIKANGTASIDRTKWNIQYGSGKFFAGLGDKMIDDEFEITFEIVAKTSKTELTVR